MQFNLQFENNYWTASHLSRVSRPSIVNSSTALGGIYLPKAGYCEIVISAGEILLCKQISHLRPQQTAPNAKFIWSHIECNRPAREKRKRCIEIREEYRDSFLAAYCYLNGRPVYILGGKTHIGDRQVINKAHTPTTILDENRRSAGGQQRRNLRNLWS